MHDFKLWIKSKIKPNPAIAIHADLAFKGLQKIHPNTILPIKASKLHKLTKEEKSFNRKVAKIRIKSEHTFRQCKIFRIVKDTYRGKHKNYGLNWNLVAAMVNLRKATANFMNSTP
jgi:predicted amidophosphoribosyltransferase